MAVPKFRPVTRVPLPQQVFDQIAEGIVGGAYEAGAYLPSERELAALLGVNRGAVREALQRLAQAGLVRVRQGGGCQVLDFRRSAGPDLLPRLLFRDGKVAPKVARSVLEMRNLLGPEIAAACAERAPAQVRAEVARRAREMSADAPLPELQDRSLDLWRAIVRGSDNVAYELSFNALRAAYEPIARTLVHVMEAELRDEAGHRALGEAVAAGDPARAKAAARKILLRSREAFASVLSALGLPSTPGGEAGGGEAGKEVTP